MNKRTCAAMIPKTLMWWLHTPAATRYLFDGGQGQKFNAVPLSPQILGNIFPKGCTIHFCAVDTHPLSYSTPIKKGEGAVLQQAGNSSKCSSGTSSRQQNCAEIMCFSGFRSDARLFFGAVYCGPRNNLLGDEILDRIRVARKRVEEHFPGPCPLEVAKTRRFGTFAGQFLAFRYQQNVVH